jgi:FAD/FMN-containing dehydrogenase
MHDDYLSWGRFPHVSQTVREIQWRSEPLPDLTTNRSFLAYGMGRSYGDVCLNNGGTILATSAMSRLISFDEEDGLLRCDAGICLNDLLEYTVPRGWFVQVTPGTKYVTLGGMIANDVHGKNHHRVGTFGCHVNCFELLRSDGSRLICSPNQNAELFTATIGGLGLTGLITWAEIRLKKIQGPYIDTESIRFDSLAEFFELSQDSDSAWEYTVAWIDSLAKGKRLGRGLFMRGNHSATPGPDKLPSIKQKLTIPIDAPSYLLNKYSIKLFNNAYYRKQLSKTIHKPQYFDKYFYPLDGIGRWNRLYGKKGLLQYQCVVPINNGEEVISKILKECSNKGQGSFLSVLKLFGKIPSPGILSFPREGATLALDFPNRGVDTFLLLDTLDKIVIEADGAVYPAKDARMASTSFKSYYPNWNEFEKYIDPHFSSSFWRRVTSKTGK